MSVGAAIFNILSTDAVVGPLLAKATDPVTYKVYPLHGLLMEDTPFVTYQEISVTPSNTSNAPSNLDAIRLQINVVHDNYDGAKTLAEAVRNALDYKKGTFANVPVQYISFQSSNDIYEDASKLQGAVMIAQDYLVRLIR